MMQDQALVVLQTLGFGFVPTVTHLSCLEDTLLKQFGSVYPPAFIDNVCCPEAQSC